MSTDQNMSELVFTKDARAALDVFLSSWPAVTRSSFEQKIVRTLDYYRLQGKARWVTKEVLIAALEETFPSFEVTVKVFGIFLRFPFFRVSSFHAPITVRRYDGSGYAFLSHVLPLGTSFILYPKSSRNLGFIYL